MVYVNVQCLLILVLDTSPHANKYGNDTSKYEIAPSIYPSDTGELPTIPTQNRLPFVLARAQYNQFFLGSWNMFISLETIGRDILLASLETNICNLFDLTRPVQMVVRKATRGRGSGLHKYSQAVVQSGIGSKFREYFSLILTYSNFNGC